MTHLSNLWAHLIEQPISKSAYSRQERSAKPSSNPWSPSQPSQSLAITIMELFHLDFQLELHEVNSFATSVASYYFSLTSSIIKLLYLGTHYDLICFTTLSRNHYQVHSDYSSILNAQHSTLRVLTLPQPLLYP